MGQNLKNAYKHLVLDYPDSAYTKALENGQNRYLVFEGRIMEPKHSAIPRGERFGGTHTTAPPCTLNGFIACRSDEIIPEFKFERENAQTPEGGSVIWVVEDGVKHKAAVYNFKDKKFVPFTEE